MNNTDRWKAFGLYAETELAGMLRDLANTPHRDETNVKLSLTFASPGNLGSIRKALASAQTPLGLAASIIQTTFETAADAR